MNLMDSNNFDLNILQNNPRIYYVFSNQSLLSFKKMWFWVRSPAVASTAIADFLHNITFSDDLSLEYFNSELGSANAVLAFAGVGAANYIYQIPEKLLQQILSGHSPFLNFVAVRNPYDRAISSLNYIQKWNNQERSLLDTLKQYCYQQSDEHFMPLSDVIYYDHIKYDFIVRFEALEYDMKILFPQYRSIQAIKQRNKAFGAELLGNDEFIEFVQKFYHDDFEKFGYSRDVKEMYEYDNSVIPRSLDKWQNPQNYPCDISLLSGESCVNVKNSYATKITKQRFDNIGSFIAHFISVNKWNIPNIIQHWKNRKLNK